MTVAGAGLVLAALSACGRPMASAPAETASRLITVSGEGFVTAKPDLATTTAGVLTQGVTAAEALAENNRRMTTLFEVIKGLGIEAKDVQTANLQVNPRYAPPDPAKPTGSDSLIVGYDASNEITIRIRNLDRLGETLDKFVSAAGANSMRGVSFDFANPEPLLDTARKNAVADAKRKAVLYADASGVKLGPVQSLNENGSSYPRPYYAMEKAMAMSAPVPVAAGENRLQANVSVTFSIE